MGNDSGSEIEGLEVVSRKFAHMLAEPARNQLQLYHMLDHLWKGGCRLRYTDHGLRSRIPPIMPYAPMQRVRLFTGTRETGAWNVDAQLAQFQGGYYYGFSNGRIDEDDPGQRILIRSSEDAVHWSEPMVIAGGEGSRGGDSAPVGLSALMAGWSPVRKFLLPKRTAYSKGGIPSTRVPPLTELLGSDRECHSEAAIE